MSRTVLILTLFCAPAVFAGDDPVEAVGEAAIKDDLVAAKRAATADALRKCVEQVVGISLQSEFTATQQELVKNNQAEFQSQVRDNLLQKSEGFVDKYEVLEEGAHGDIYKVKIRARVFTSKLVAAARELADLLATIGNPKLMLVIQEVYIPLKGKPEVAADSILAAYLEKELLERGFELRAKDQAKTIASGTPSGFDHWLADAAAAASMARQNGADIVIAGRVEIQDQGKIDDTAPFEALRGQTRVEIKSIIRGLNAASMDVLSSKPVQMPSIGIDVPRAVHRAFKGRGENVVKQTFDQLLTDLTASFRKTATGGQTYVVELRGVKSFRKQGQRFMELLGKLADVSTVQQKSFAEGTLTLDLQCKCSSDELQQRIFKAVGSAREFPTLDVHGVSGKQISFKL
ncbi:MAG: flagellar assembly protein T N-terminal domain-containing protein [Deltaproteobacteria bacterium]|nr:flagellar assembly protein T N-terminal domain-containing protein [Deltaproteobacteria bacterium]